MADPVNPDKLKQIVVPAVAAAAVVILIGVLVMSSNFGPKPGGGPAGLPAAAPDGTPLDTSDAGMADAAPKPDAPEWKDYGDGLKAWDVKEGAGDPCPRGARVVAHYTGWLTDGTKFDSSRDKGSPTAFGLDGVVKGWTNGIPGMKRGGIRRLLIPAELGYGSAGRPGIPGGATMLFEVKLVNF